MSAKDLNLALSQSMPELPPAREFLTSAGFAGATALAAAILVIFIARRGLQRIHQQNLEQRQSHHQETRDDEQHAQAVTRCWQRLVWVVETAAIEPAASEGATLGLGPELALELLRGLLRDAEQLGDHTLANAATVYLDQLTRVLAQQGGPLSGLTLKTSAPATNTAPEAPPRQAPATREPATDDPENNKRAVAAGRGRRQQ